MGRPKKTTTTSLLEKAKKAKISPTPLKYRTSDAGILDRVELATAIAGGLVTEEQALVALGKDPNKKKGGSVHNNLGSSIYTALKRGLITIKFND